MNTTGDSYYCTELVVGPVVWGGFCILCTCIGLPASVWLLWVLIQRQRRGLSNDVYMLNLTIMDLIFNIFTIPGLFNFFTWRLHTFSQILDVLYHLNLCGRPLLMACICVDCYMAVVHPISFMKLKHGRHRIGVCALDWAFTLMYGFMAAFGQGLVNSYFFMMPFVLSLPTITFCDVIILRALRKPSPSGRNDIHPQKQKALQTIINSLTMAIVAYLPPLVVFGFSPLFPLSAAELWCNVSLPTLFAPLLGSSIMPVLYLHNLGCLKVFLGRCGCA